MQRLLFWQEWNQHFFVLTSTKLHYTEETSRTNAEDDDDDDGSINTNEVGALSHVAVSITSLID